MKFRRKNKEKQKEKKEKAKKNENEIEIIMGDDSNLDISDVGDYVNDLKPKAHENQKKKFVIPKSKKD